MLLSYFEMKMLSLLNLGSLAMCRYGQIAGWSDLWRVGLLVLQKKKVVGLPSLSAIGVVNPDKTFPPGTGFPPIGYKGNFREQHYKGRKPTTASYG